MANINNLSKISGITHLPNADKNATCLHKLNTTSVTEIEDAKARYNLDQFLDVMNIMATTISDMATRMNELNEQIQNIQNYLSTNIDSNSMVLDTN